MRKILFSMTPLLLVLLIACTSKEESSTRNDESESNNAKSRAVYKAIETGDVSGLDSIIAEDFVDHTAMGDIKSRDSVKAMLGDMHNHIDGLKFDVIAQATSGDYHFSLVNFKGTLKDDYMGMKKGTSMDMKGVDVVRMKNGKAVEHWDFIPSSEMSKMMPGPMPATVPSTNTPDTTKKY